MRKSRLYNFSREEIGNAINSSNTRQELLEKLGFKHSGNFVTLNKIINEYNLTEDYNNLKERSKDALRIKVKNLGKNKLSEDLIFIVNSKVSGNSLRRYILKNNLLPYICSKCGNNGTWEGEELGLQVHHINGIHNDNRLENLTFLCPNCHSQTDNFMNKDRDEKKKIRDKEIKKAERNLKNQIFIEERKKYFDSIDMTKFGWIAQAEKDLGISHTQIRRWIKKHYPEKENFKRSSPS